MTYLGTPTAFFLSSDIFLFHTYQLCLCHEFCDKDDSWRLEIDIEQLRMAIFTIILAAGQQGSATAVALLKEGHKVHAVVRNNRSPLARQLAVTSADITLFEASFQDVESMRKAAVGTEGILLNLPIPNLLDPSEDIRNVENGLNAAC